MTQGYDPYQTLFHLLNDEWIVGEARALNVRPITDQERVALKHMIRQLAESRGENSLLNRFMDLMERKTGKRLTRPSRTACSNV